MQDRWTREPQQNDKDGQHNNTKKRPANWDDRYSRKKDRLRRRGRREMIEDLRLSELEETND